MLLTQAVFAGPAVCGAAARRCGERMLKLIPLPKEFRVAVLSVWRNYLKENRVVFSKKKITIYLNGHSIELKLEILLKQNVALIYGLLFICQ